MPRRPGLITGPHARFGSRLRRLRLARGMTQKQLGRAIGSSCNEISDYESSRSLPGFRKLVALADALWVSLDELAHGRPAARDAAPRVSAALPPPAAGASP